MSQKEIRGVGARKEEEKKSDKLKNTSSCFLKI